jgi:hypothetical protein
MSDDTTATEPTSTETDSGNSGFTPPATQEDLNRIIADRVTRERAKYADYGDLKTRAAKYDEVEQANKTELQRATERAEAAERDAEQTKSEALRLRVIAKHQIPEDHQDLVFGGDEAELTARAAKVQALIGLQAAAESSPAVRELFVPSAGKSAPTALNGDGIESALKAKLGI